MSREVLGLGPLEEAIMYVAWQAGEWLRVRAIYDRLDYPKPLAFTTVSAVVIILWRKGLLIRRRWSAGRWEYQQARPLDEHIGDLIGVLLDTAPDPGAALAHALHRPATNTALAPIKTGGVPDVIAVVP